MRTVITIGRQLGSGGREIGLRLAKKLGIPFYDKELLRKAAEETGLSEKLFDSFDERPKSLLYSIAMDSYMFALPGVGVSDSLEQQVYQATFGTIRRVAGDGPCVIIGRCADYALEDRDNVLNLFIHAPLERRIAVEARRQILRTDKRRASYYEYYSAKKWGAVDSYDFCLNSSIFGYEGTVELIETLIRMKER
ncbi:cytidylate kinase-like family protein [Oscillibacter sp.]|uniref:cytidylate kinase-like family protein n=1 Tax=Oscillibacter sp. TaxID=1945593 RepID=UPI0028A6CB94|nr:cytidylate kinase-like family protein [Oscillibacter sp.]